MTNTHNNINKFSSQNKRELLAKLLQEKVEQPHIFPMSFTQQRLWFIEQLQPGNFANHIRTALRLVGSLNKAALLQTLNEILRRHEVLRTTFATIEGKPVQVIIPNLSLGLPTINLEELTGVEQEAEIHKLVTQEVQQPFDLSQAPLLRATLLRLKETEHILVFTMHHIIFDGWSIGVLVKEVTALYEAFSKCQPSPLAELPIQYVDFASWQRQKLQGEVLKSQISYWKQQLEGVPQLLELPTDKPRPAVSRFHGATYSFELSHELHMALKKLSQQKGNTLFISFLAVFKTLLYQYTNSEDIVIGSPIVNRDRIELEGLIGLFANTIALRTNLADNPTFEELLTRVRKVALGANAHQNLPFEQLVEELQPQRSLSYTPVFQVMFILQNTPISVLKLPGLTISPFAIKNGSAKFDLILEITETAGKLFANLEFNTDLFEPVTIKRMAGHFQTLLKEIIANPKLRLSELSLLTESEQHQLLVQWNNTEVEYPLVCIHKLFEAQVEKTPNAIAVVFEDQQLTYWELNAKANKLAHHLRSLEVKPEVLVGICVERSLDMVIGLLAILKAGGAYVPLDPNYPQERLAYMLEDSQPSVLLTQQFLLESLPYHQAQVICIDSNWEQIASESTKNPTSNTTIDNLAYVIYTSGSTGKPKGAMNSHSGICNRLLWMQDTYQLTSADAVLQKTPFSFDVSVWEFFWTLMTGARLVVTQPEGHRDPNYLVNLIRKQRVTTLHFVPSMLQAFLEAEGLEKCQSLVRVIASGEALPAQLQERFFNRLNAQLHNLYGPTEAAVDVTYWQCKKDNLSNQDTVPIGQPIANIQIYILDKYLKPVPMGVAGEVYIGGIGVARGYLNRPDLSAQKFIPNPFSKKATRLYKTGDLARSKPSGDIEYIGRIDNQVKVRGFRIELGEIEAVISQYPAVRETVVVVREDSVDSQRIVAYVVADPEQTVRISQLRSFLESKLPSYMVPTAFVTLEALPLTPNGKVDRKALPVPDGEIIREQEYVAPRTVTEETLVDIWQELLHKEKVSIHDNFFEIGGDSILSIQVISRAKNSGIQITTRQIFRYQTIAELARVVNTTVSVSVQQDIVTGTAPLTPIQHWFFAQNKDEAHHFNQSVLLHLPNDIKPELLEKAVEKLLEHHDALRLRFKWQASEYEQINYDRDKNIPFSVVDLSSTPRREQPQTLSKIAIECQVSLNLSTGPIMRAVMFNLGSDGDARLLIIIHHLAVDGVSWRILLSDLQIIYQQIIAQQPIQLNAKTTAFIDWAEKLNNYAQSEILKQELDYWLNQPWSKTTPLPLDYARAHQENTVGSAASVSVELSVEETRTLLESVNEAYNTQINDILLSALILSLAQWGENSTVVINLEGHGREELFDSVDLSRTVGWFTSLFPVSLQLPDLDQLASVIKSIKEQLRTIPNRGIGYGILRYLCKDTTVSQQLQKIPTPEISFNYLGQFDQLESQSDWKFASESTGAKQGSRQIRDHLLDVNALVIKGKLQIDWTYSSNFHTQTTLENLAQSYVETIRSLIEHCQSKDTFGYTPSDFIDVQLNQSELDELLENLYE